MLEFELKYEVSYIAYHSYIHFLVWLFVAIKDYSEESSIAQQQGVHQVQNAHAKHVLCGCQGGQYR